MISSQRILHFKAQPAKWRGVERQAKFMTSFRERFYIEVKMYQRPQWKIHWIVRAQHTQRYDFTPFN